LICYSCHEVTRHGMRAEDQIFICSYCRPSTILKIKNGIGNYDYTCVYQEQFETDSCHERMIQDKAHEKNGKYYAHSLICPKGHTRIVVGY